VVALVLTLAVAVLTGCDKKNSSFPSTQNPHQPSPYEARMQAAFQIIDQSKRNEALDEVARDAAKDGDVGIVRRATLAITDPDARNNSAAACAEALAKAGKRQEAIAIANLITGMTLRDSTLAKLAGK